MRSVKRVRHDYLIEIVNNSKDEQDIVILEAAPISRNEQITVSFDSVSPSALEIEDKTRINKVEGILEWHFKMPGKGKQEIRYSSIVEHPASLSISGMAL